MSFRLAVLSDLHIDRRADADSWELAKAAFEAALAEGVDHLLVAGDYFDSASAMHRDRDRAQTTLRRLGPWHRDRLSLVIGGHDLFQIGHRGSLLPRIAVAAQMLKAGRKVAHDEYCAWAGELVPAKDRHWSNALFPYRRRLDGVTVVAADSTPDTTLEAAEGRWPKDEDRAVRALLHGIKGVRAWAARITAASQRRRQSDASPALYPWA